MTSPAPTSAPTSSSYPREFEAFIQNLFTKMGFDTKLYQASGDSGIDLVAYDPHPITGGKFIVQAKLYTRTVQPTHVRDLWGTVQHEGATKGIMITTSGYGPDSYKFAGGKPLNLIDGSGLLALCQQYEIPARILNRGKENRPPEPVACRVLGPSSAETRQAASARVNHPTLRRCSVSRKPYFGFFASTKIVLAMVAVGEVGIVEAAPGEVRLQGSPGAY